MPACARWRVGHRGLCLCLVVLVFLCAGAGRTGGQGQARRFASGDGLQFSATTGTSSNWAGYVLLRGGVTSVSGSWTVPLIAASWEERASGAWIGIGGAETHDLIQAGTAQVTAAGALGYELWYEALPARPVRIGIDVAPGDQISIAIWQTGDDLWSIRADDLTNGLGETHTIRYHSSLSSADWIIEAPSDLAGNIKPLANFGVIHFSNAAATVDGQPLDLSSARPVTMRESGADLVRVSDTDGAAFDAIYAAGP